MSTTKLGIQRCTVAQVAAWPRGELQGVIKSISKSGVFVRFGNGTATCSKDGLLRGVDAKTVELEQSLSVRVSAVDVDRNRVTLELATPSSSELCCYRCGVFGHRVRDCPSRPEPIACFKRGGGRRVTDCDSASSADGDACSIQSSRSGRRARNARRPRGEMVEARTETPAAVPAAVPENAEPPAGNAKERRRARRAAEHAEAAALASETERQLCEWMRSALARRGVPVAPADAEETLRAKLQCALAADRTGASFFANQKPAPVVAPPPPLKFGSFSVSDGFITASLIDEFASGTEPPAALLRRLSSAGAA